MDCGFTMLSKGVNMKLKKHIVRSSHLMAHMPHDGFSGYRQIQITKEYRHNTTFIIEWGCFQYTVMPFGLKNAPAIFSRVVVTAFKDFIQQFLQVCMDDWIVYGLVRNHLAILCLMLERCWQHQIELNSKKCIFCAPFRIPLRHNVCKQGLLVDPTKIALILSLSQPTNVKIVHGFFAAKY